MGQTDGWTDGQTDGWQHRLTSFHLVAGHNSRIEQMMICLM